ncbi:MAG: DUF3604 domain-containing protein [Armatimonadota bacterium]
MDAYPNKSSRRVIISEIEEYAARKAGIQLINGFSEIRESPGTITGGPRVAGFMESHDLRDWYLPLKSGASMSWSTHPVPNSSLNKAGFVFSTGFGNGSPLPQPSGKWKVYVNGRYALSVRAVKHSQKWSEGDCTLVFTANRIESAEPFGSICLSSIITADSFAAFGPAILTVPMSWIHPGKPAEIRIEASPEVDSERWLHLAAAPSIIMSEDIYKAIDLLASVNRYHADSQGIYFGDIHTHSGEADGHDGYSVGCGMASRRSNYEYAKGPGGMDFYALTDHEWQVHPDKIGAYMGLADEYNEDGSFVSLPAFEFTSLLYGHRNVYFRDSGGTIINSMRGWSGLSHDPDLAVSPDELWNALDGVGIPSITIPHHPSATSHPCSWDFYNPKYDRLVEIYSSWGSSEYYGDFPRGVSDRYRTLNVRDALKRGLRMGFAGGADGHDGHPGDAQSPVIKHHHIFHHLGSGLTAVLCGELTRHGVFDALHDRRCYATTGVPILLSFNINGAMMGSEIPPLQDGKLPVLQVKCIGTNGISQIRIMKNSTVAATVLCNGEFDTELEWVDTAYSNKEPANYYIRVIQKDYESAWSSPIWIG